eukprot:scaffold721_cov235-Pinguiococcus_pyrenoidosus.AAC.6
MAFGRKLGSFCCRILDSLRRDCFVPFFSLKESPIWSVSGARIPIKCRLCFVGISGQSSGETERHQSAASGQEHRGRLTQQSGRDQGFAGSTADAFTLLERLEGKLEAHPGQLTRACVELAKAWRTDKYLRRLEAYLLVADGAFRMAVMFHGAGTDLVISRAPGQETYELTGNGDVLSPVDGVMAVGSGSPFATAAAVGTFPDGMASHLCSSHQSFRNQRALLNETELDAESIANKAMKVPRETMHRWADFVLR